ncbi:MAG: hypothetical protein HKN35_13050 [Woeseia sp.]|nr:hypothetical protein [Woeseia sp.]NNE61817.1 hypothetical protein [Woeseia sp.]NNL53893.1 hypothetical protein [Woeseia sp.]
MKSSKLIVTALLALGTLGLTACGNSSNDVPLFVPPPPAPPPAQPESFTMFVKEQFANTADDTDPVEINELDIDFDNADNPNAFDDLLQSN